MLQQRVEYDVVAETVGKLQIFLVAGYGSYISKCLVEASMLTAQHILHLSVGQVSSDALHPIGQFHEHVFRLITVCNEIGVTQSSISLMYII